MGRRTGSHRKDCKTQGNKILSRLNVGLLSRMTSQYQPITTKVVSLNPVHGKVYLIQHYVVKFVSYLRQVCGFSPGTPVSSINKIDCHDITEILLKVALNTINLSLSQYQQINNKGKYYIPQSSWSMQFR